MSPNATGEPQPHLLREPWVHVGPEPIVPSELHRQASSPEVGGVSQFCGTVRNHNQGAAVIKIEYEAYPDMAIEVIRKIVHQASLQWPFWTASAVHRTGTLTIGDVAVCVTIGASHREAAFTACRYVIDQLKLEAPIWKRETLETGDHRWVEEDRPPASPGE